MKTPKGYISTVEFAVPQNLTATINITKDGTTIVPFTVSVTDDSGKLVVPLPYKATWEQANIVVNATFIVSGQTYTRKLPVEVYTPYLELWEIKKILGPTATPEECWSVEAAVRNVINAHTGQSFGYAHKTLTLTADAGSALPLPERILTIEKVVEDTTTKFDIAQLQGTSYLGAGQFVITGDGWFLKQPSWDTNTYNNAYQYSTSDPIVAPTRRGGGTGGMYINDAKYALTGTFGYETVPEPVQEAAKLLINDYACAEQIYRDRFIEDMKAADWAFVYNSGAYYKTGNARANLLLSPYVVVRMKVI